MSTGYDSGVADDQALERVQQEQLKWPKQPRWQRTETLVRLPIVRKPAIELKKPEFCQQRLLAQEQRRHHSKGARRSETPATIQQHVSVLRIRHWNLPQWTKRHQWRSGTRTPPYGQRCSAAKSHAIQLLEPTKARLQSSSKQRHCRKPADRLPSLRRIRPTVRKRPLPGNAAEYGI